ncbi:ornithine decarboxylase-like, partial [Plectropomus leopardus]|uniref:ornithine decarboxylase-like n=1 Tax=Plectropomus leopardus TaxID=160734 RepID=UPI001C4D017C
MDVCEDNKVKVCTSYQRRREEEDQQPDPPAACCVSMKTDGSREEPPCVSSRPVPADSGVIREVETGAATSNASVVLSPENWDIDILDKGRTVSDFIDSKIKELSSVDIEEPFHVADLDSILRRHHRWVTNLPRVKPFYAVKCNNTAAVLKMMTVLDTGFDCASKGEIQKILSLGVSPNKIIYAHTTKPMSHLRYACAHGVDVMTFDNEDELLKVSLCHPKAKLVLRIAVDDSKSLVRLNSKFGARLVSVGKLLERAGELGVEVIGVSFHVGSGCYEGSAFRQAIVDARHVFDVG